MITPAGPSITDACRPRVAAGVRLQRDRVTGHPLLLFPEAFVELTGTGQAIVPLCDGTRSLADIVTLLSEQYNAPPALIRADVTKYLLRLNERMLLDLDSPTGGSTPNTSPNFSPITPFPDGISRPVGLIAEISYRCPLHCPYCSNPVSTTVAELTTEQWQRVLTEAADLGVLHALFSGGEPLQRPDLETLIAAARAGGLYTNLITSAVGFTPQRARSLKEAGLDSVQISFQSDAAALADSIAGTRAHELKLEAARLTRELGLPLTINVVLHRSNIGQVSALIDLAESLGARRLELASAQYYGWALKNREALLPTRAQVTTAEAIAVAAQSRLKGRMDVLYVVPDYFDDRPKPCMNGWARQYISVNPFGDVYPCPTAAEIRSLEFENVRDRSLGWIWSRSDSFNRFRGTAWMPDPCRSCDRREIDFGGCRCQAAIITGDPANTDPVCGLSPHRPLIDLSLSAVESRAATARPLFVYRSNPEMQQKEPHTK